MDQALLDHATDLAEADLRLRRALVERRRAQGLTQKDMAELMGTNVSWIKRFEHYDFDPRASDIRRYALAVGVKVEHSVRYAA